jgi:hypothetical protein
VRLGIVIGSALLLTACGGATGGQVSGDLVGAAHVHDGVGTGGALYAARAGGRGGLTGAARAVPARVGTRGANVYGAARRLGIGRHSTRGLRAGWWRDWPVPASLSHGGQAPAVTTCGLAAAVRAGGHVLWLGDCAGLYLTPGPTITVRVGQYVEIYLPQQVAGANSEQLVAVAPLPRSSDPAVLRLVATGPGGAAGAFRASRPGRASLTVAAGECVGAHSVCTVLAVTVAGRR